MRHFNLSDWAITHRALVLFMILVLGAAGAYSYFNLGRAYLAKGLINRAREQFQQALAIEPRYTLARRALENLRRMVN